MSYNNVRNMPPFNFTEDNVVHRRVKIHLLALKSCCNRIAKFCRDMLNLDIPIPIPIVNC